MTAGYWQTNYFALLFWPADFWPEYGAGEPEEDYVNYSIATVISTPYTIVTVVSIPYTIVTTVNGEELMSDVIEIIQGSTSDIFKTYLQNEDSDNITMDSNYICTQAICDQLGDGRTTYSTRTVSLNDDNLYFPNCILPTESDIDEGRYYFIRQIENATLTPSLVKEEILKIKITAQGIE